MRIPGRAIGLTAALVLGVAAVGMTTGHAEAKPRQPKDTGARCVLYGVEPGEDMTFYLPGETIRTYNAYSDDDSPITYRCGPDGNWYQTR
jgi:hypothetical protein